MSTGKDEKRESRYRERNASDYEQAKALIGSTLTSKKYSAVAVREALGEIPYIGPELGNVDELVHVLTGMYTAYGPYLFWDIVQEYGYGPSEEIRTDRGNSGLLLDPTNQIAIRFSGQYVTRTRLSLKERQVLGDEWRTTMIEDGSVTFYFLGSERNNIGTDTLTMPLRAGDTVTKLAARGANDRGLISVSSELRPEGAAKEPSKEPRVTVRSPPPPAK